MVISAVDMTIVNVALTDISRELDATLGELRWVLDGFLVALAGMLALASGVADRFGRRRVFLAGMAGVGVASVVCAGDRWGAGGCGGAAAAGVGLRGSRGARRRGSALAGYGGGRRVKRCGQRS
jgi:MFS family permease